jgi:uncharacterized RDD family membrane protein YckC
LPSRHEHPLAHCRAFSQDYARAFPDWRAILERTLDVATGESVAFRYELAGLGSRFFAVFIDMSIQSAVLVVALIAIGLAATHLPEAKALAGAKYANVAAAFVAAILWFAVFVLYFGYFILFEWLAGGRTPGKRLIGLRVVRDGGFPLDFTAAVVRNVVRVLEVALGFYVVSAIVALLSAQNRRLGDMAAGTLVVRDARSEAMLPQSLRETVDDPLVRDLGEPERELIRRYAARRPHLEPEAVPGVARSIADAVRPKLAASYDHVGDDDLLMYLAHNVLG